MVVGASEGLYPSGLGAPAAGRRIYPLRQRMVQAGRLTEKQLGWSHSRLKSSMFRLELGVACMAVTAPAIGELLSVRGRHWVATDICRPHTNAGDGQSLTDFFGVSDGGHSTARKMVWEVGPGLGALTTPTVPEVIAAGSDALRLGGMDVLSGEAGYILAQVVRHAQR